MDFLTGHVGIEPPFEDTKVKVFFTYSEIQSKKDCSGFRGPDTSLSYVVT